MLKKRVLMLFTIVVITITPLILIKNSEFGGADGLAEELIIEVNPSYEPWIDNFISPPGGETESLLFALQASLGALVIGYVLGYYKGKRDE